MNLAGRNKLPMTGLRSLVASAGHKDVVTYIQSGNVVFQSSSGDADEVAAGIERRIAKEFGLAIAVLLRTRAELAAIEAGNPYPGRAHERSKLHVLFLRDEPAPEAVAGLDPNRSPGDEFNVRGREIYLHLAGGAAHTKLTLGYFERALGIEGTARNWNTLLRLGELTSAT